MNLSLKRFCCALLLLFFLAGCATAVPTPTATASAAPSLTLSPSPTLTPSITPSPTITPTPLPPTPDSAQGFDYSRQLYSRTADGSVEYYIPELKDWAIALDQSPIPLVNTMDYPKDVAEAWAGVFKSMVVHYYRMPGAEQPFLSVEVPREYDSGWFGNKFSIDPRTWNSPQTQVLMFLAARQNKLTDKTALTAEMLGDVLKQIARRSLVLALNVPAVAKDNSQVTTKYWDPNQNIDVIQVPWKSTANDPSYFGRLSVSYHWKLDVRGGQDSAHPGRLLVYFATPYVNRVKHDFIEANTFLLGPLYPALLSQQEPQIDFITDRADDFNDFNGEAVWIHSTKGISYEDLHGPFFTFDLGNFAFSASGPNPFFKYTCIHFSNKDGTQSVIDCYYANWTPVN